MNTLANVAVTEVTITKRTYKGLNAVRYDVDKNGVPFGQIWTYRAKGEPHGYHAKTLAGAYKFFRTYEAAETFIRGQM